METVTDFIFLGSKITVDRGCSYEIKRRLLLGRKTMSNLDSILKSRDITLPTKVHIVKGMVHIVKAMYGCESRTIKNAECWRIDSFELWCWRRLLRIFWTARRSIQLIVKAISPEYSLEGLMLELKLQYFGHWCKELSHWKRPWWEGDDRGWDSWMASQLNGHEFLRKLHDLMIYRGTWNVAVHGVTKIWTRLSNWTSWSACIFGVVDIPLAYLDSNLWLIQLDVSHDVLSI